MSSSPTVRIHGHDFPLTERYSAGHILTEHEASALNQVHRENTANNHRTKIKEHIDGNTFDLDAYRKTLSEAHDAYEFGQRRVSSRVPADPIEAEAQRLAIAAVRAALAKKGVTNVPIETIKAKAEEVLANPDHGPKLRKTAANNVKSLEALTGGDGAVVETVADVESGAKRQRKTKAQREAAAEAAAA